MQDHIMYLTNPSFSSSEATLLDLLTFSNSSRSAKRRSGMDVLISEALRPSLFWMARMHLESRSWSTSLKLSNSANELWGGEFTRRLALQGSKRGMILRFCNALLDKKAEQVGDTRTFGGGWKAHRMITRSFSWWVADIAMFSHAGMIFFVEFLQLRLNLYQT